MAGLLVGGWFASEFVAQLVEKLFNYIRDQYKYQSSEILLMEKLEMRLTEILGVLYEADNRMIKNPHLNSWLLDLKDAALDADDVLDSFEYRQLLQQAKGRRFSSNFVKRLAFRDPHLNELIDLVDRFDRLVGNKEAFLRFLDTAPEYNQAGNVQLSVKSSVPAKPILVGQEWEKEGSSEMPIVTTSVPTQPDLIGREFEREKLVGMLLSREEGSWFINKVNIVPIVGNGGIGKTILAQFIYNDDRVKNFFDIRAWVSVSGNFDVKIIMTKIMESITTEVPSKFYQIQNEDVIQKILINILLEKRFLIILDDVRNEDRARWEMLNASFKSGKDGSWVVVTTRNPKIADMMRTVSTVELNSMTEEEFWIFFQKCAFGNAHPEDYPSLESLGREIAMKLGRSTLAAKTLGDVLKFKLEENGWREILHSKLSVPTELNLTGRELEKKLLVEILRSGDNDKVNIVPIVGIGGIGKTALAKFIYDDFKVDKQSKTRAWVSVSDSFDVRNIMIKIIESAKIEKPSDFYQIQNEDVIQKILIDGLKEKKFLIILDDVWNEDKSRWEMLNASLKYGKEGSWVVVTTRNPKIADMMRTVPILELESMGDEEFWIFFRKCAFGDANPEDHLNLQSLGREIAKKLQGNPLAAKTLGAVLNRYLDQGHWREILKTKLCNIEQGADDILPALQVSYMHLPVHLKQCFVYCSLFPKDFNFDKMKVVHLWMAQGFITQTEKNKEKTLESIAESYFDELLSRGFFQLSPIYFGFDYYVIHDLLHDLAQFVSNREYATVEDDNIISIPRRVLHLYIQGCNLQMAWKATCVKRRLRSLVIYGDFEVDILSNCLQELKGLRVLIINGNVMAENFPNCFTQLAHLRYLELGMNLHKLPKSLFKLYHLQVLYMHGSFYQDSLIKPQKISKLSKLRHTNIRPEKISRLGDMRSLQSLPNYNVLQDSDHGISQLKDMNQIRGQLSIQSLENILNEQMALEANLSNKIYIHFLTLVWNSQNHAKSEEVLEALQPHKDLEDLEIKNYPGTKNPSWLVTNWLSSVLSVELSNCLNLESLPSLGQLPLLKYLTLSHLDKITKIGAELYGVCTSKAVAFPMLSELRIVDMPKLQEWGDVGRDMVVYPYLSYLCIIECPKFTSFRGPIALPPTLKVLEFYLTDLSYDGHRRSKLTLAVCIKGQKLRWEWFPVHRLSYLEEVTMPKNLPKSFPTNWFQQLNNVKKLQLYGCYGVYSLHDGVRSLPALEVLILHCCYDIVLNDRDLRLKELHIEHIKPHYYKLPYHPWNLVVRCPNVQTITVDGRRYVLEDDSMVAQA